jgi:hypothetical protein
MENINIAVVSATKVYDFSKIFTPVKTEKQKCPDGMLVYSDFLKAMKTDFMEIKDIQAYKNLMTSIFCYAPGLSENEATYKSKAMNALCEVFTAQFKIFQLEKLPGDKGRILGFKLIQLAISLEDEKSIKNLLSLQSAGVFSCLSGLTYEGLKSEVLSFDLRQKEMIALAEKNRLERERIEKVKDEISAMENALITLRLHKLPIKGMETKINELKLSIA